MQIGIVGLPNVGKSTLFKALTKKQVEASNYPFCTIDPNVGAVEVADERLDKLAKIYNSQKTIHTTIEFVDIAGLVKNAHKGEGLGNQFLSHIREVDAIAHVIRNFHDDNVSHITGKIEPQEDLTTVEIELAMADINTIEKILNKKDSTFPKTVLENIINKLNNNQKPEFVKGLNLLTLKPELYIENIDEEQLKDFKPTIANSIPICAKLEADLVDLDNNEAKEYLTELGIKKSGLDQLIEQSYKLLNLITFFTLNPNEAHAWTIKQGTKAPQAAGKVHTDFEQGFIRAEIINWQELLNANSELKAKEKGLIRTEGKDYIIKDGDVAFFRFNT